MSNPTWPSNCPMTLSFVSRCAKISRICSSKSRTDVIVPYIYTSILRIDASGLKRYDVIDMIDVSRDVDVIRVREFLRISRNFGSDCLKGMHENVTGKNPSYPVTSLGICFMCASKVTSLSCIACLFWSRLWRDLTRRCSWEECVSTNTRPCHGEGRIKWTIESN